MKTKDIKVGEEYYLRTRRFGSASRGRVVEIGVPRKGSHGFHSARPIGIRVQILDKNGDPATARNSPMAEWFVKGETMDAQVPYIRVLLPQDVRWTWAEQLERETTHKAEQKRADEYAAKRAAELIEKNTPRVQALREVGVSAELTDEGEIRIVGGKAPLYGNTHRSLSKEELIELVTSLAERLDAALTED